MKKFRGYSYLIISLILTIPVFGQQVDVNSEIIVQFADDSFVMSENKSLIRSLNGLIKIDSTLQRTLQGLSFKQIERTIPLNAQETLSGLSKNGRGVEYHDIQNIYTIRINGNVERALERLNNNPLVLFAEKNFTERINSVTPNDTELPSQWALTNNINGINADDAWTITKGSPNNIIGILDSGVESWHNEIGNKLISPDQGSSDDVNSGWHSHGFSVAGIAAAVTDNSNGIAGIDWYAKIYSRRIDGSGTSSQYNSIMNLVNNNVDIINMSYGTQTSYSTLIRKALTNAYNMNITLVASMGNENHGNTNYPAGYDGIISVGATDANRNRYETSTLAGVYGSNWGNHIDVVAPGVTIAPEKPGNDQGFDPDPLLRTFTLTSAAAPQVTGIASLLLSVRSDLYNDDIKNLIQLSAIPVPQMVNDGVEWDPEFGHGLANAYEAVKRLESPYVLTHHTVGNGMQVGNTGTYSMHIFGFSGLSDGIYAVERYEVNKVITYPYMAEPNVWCRGADENGYAISNPNFGMGWCEPKYVSNDIAELRTYVYKVYNPFWGGFLGWYPTGPSNVKFSYTVHGIQTTEPFTAQIIGPANVQIGQTGQWFATASGGQTPYSYSWQKSTTSSNGPWTVLGSGSTYSQTVSNDMWLKLNATESCSGGLCPSTSAIHFVSATGIPLKEVNEGQINIMPDKFDLLGNYPNPFNPSTNISYDISEQSDVLLEVYNLFGQKIATVVNENQSQGRYSAIFDARNIATGVYILRLYVKSISGVNFQKTIKISLVK